ncbi:MAG: hypothetical protein LLG06_06435 [Desulfobacteraceae bacterium]|nr:hypothetical protein [Desulfobacteraceae bacterium]
MQDDLVAGLTRQVKEEVVENYVRERRLLELQMEHLRDLARQTHSRASATGKRLGQLARLAVCPEMLEKMLGILDVKEKGCFWTGFLDEADPVEAEPFEVRALTRRGKFRKLVLQSYARLSRDMNEYRKDYDELVSECGAVNANIAAFGRNFDLLSILNFLRSLDMQALEMKKILGDNFTAREMAELDKNLYIRPVTLDRLGVPVPINLPDPRAVETAFSELADEVYRKHCREVAEILSR